MFCFFWRSGSTQLSAPLAMIELPPTVSAFSIRSTCAPASCASMAAASPAKPVPTITTSVLRSHFFGGSTARSTRGVRSPVPTTPAVTAAPAISWRLVTPLVFSS